MHRAPGCLSALGHSLLRPQDSHCEEESPGWLLGRRNMQGWLCPPSHSVMTLSFITVLLHHP